MKKLLFSLFVGMAACILPAQNVIPVTAKAPPLDGAFDAADWQNALYFEKFQFMQQISDSVPMEQTRLWFLQDKNTLYLAAVLEDENVAALVEKQDADLVREPWQLSGIEMFFGESGFIQLAFDYMGRLYKNFDAPVFTKVSHRKSSIVLRCAIPLRLIPRMNLSNGMTRANFYRKSTFGQSSWHENKNRNFLDMTQTGILLFDTPGNLISAKARGYHEQIDALRKADGIDEQAAAQLKNRINSIENAAREQNSDQEQWLSSLAYFPSLQKDIAGAQQARMIEKYGRGKRVLLRKPPLRTAPEAWLPPMLAGRDYWYMYTMLGVEDMEKAGLMEIPLLREAMFLVRWGQPGVHEFLPPDGKNYKILQKYGNPFAVNTIDRLHITNAEAQKPEFKAMFDKAFMDQFYATYGDRFVGFFENEAFACDTGIFARTLRHFHMPEPKNRDEALAAFAKLYSMRSDKVPDYAPFRNLANMSEYTCQYVGNTAATQLNHLVHYCGDQISGNENGDVMGATAPKIAFARGAGRQYGKPWRNYQVFYGWTYLKVANGGMRCATKSSGPWINSVEKLLTPDCRAIAYCYLDGLKVGMGLEREKAAYLYPYLSGVGIWSSEADLEEITSVYDCDEIAGVDPLVINLRDQKLHLSPMARLHAHFYDQIVKKRDRGVAMTPVGLIWDRAHGYLPLYFGNRTWDFFNPDEMEKTMWALDNHLFKRNPVNHSYATSRYGDIFDVITNEAGQKILDTYPVLYPVGDVALDTEFAERLKKYVQSGGILVLNAALLKRYPHAFTADFTGCTILEESGSSHATYSLIDQSVVQESAPYSYCKTLPAPDSSVYAVTTDPAQAPAILARDYGKGRVVVTTPENLKVGGSMHEMLNLFDHLMNIIRNHVLEIRIETTMQYAINRNQSGWIVYLQNNAGVYPSGGVFKDAPPVTDTSKTASAVITVPASLGKVRKVIDWWSGKEVFFETTGIFGRGDAIVKASLPGGDCCALEFIIR